MEKNLVIVESPAKAKTIEKFLGPGYTVKSSFGHIRDLAKKNLGIDIENGFSPQYVIPDDKKSIVADLKKAASAADIVWLASDEDREGEAISWHLYEVLNLKKKPTHRIVFNEITKNAILEAIRTPRDVDQNLVNAQQARRILDRLVGFEISPILWKKIKPSLSAGRVQSVAVKLLVEREREIEAFSSISTFKVQAVFNCEGNTVTAELNRKFDTKEEAEKFLEDCISASYKVESVESKPARRTPAPPFTTSTLQQEAARKLGFSVAQTMSVAQHLYEAGLITYMRTDSVNLSSLALGTSKNTIIETYGEDYSQPRNYKTKTKGAQEAHEAIRPTYIDRETITGTAAEKRLYELIRKRTLASQMSDALLERTTVTVDISTRDEKFVAVGEVVKFDGFLKVYSESVDDEPEAELSVLPSISRNSAMDAVKITATQKYSQHPPRYTEASLVKKLEELGIGRPSTYAPTISTILQRDYAVKDKREGQKREYSLLTLHNGKLNESVKTEVYGAEKNKLFPQDIGIVVNDFLEKHFPDIMNYGFTADVEKEFDNIATGNCNWVNMIGKFYNPFHKSISAAEENADRTENDRRLGIDPVSGKPVIARISRFGALVQIGETSDSEKPRFASLLKNQRIGTITLEEALDLFKLPRKLGQFEEKDVVVNTGRFGPYILHNGKYTSINSKIDDPLGIGLDRAVELILAKRESDLRKILLSFPEEPELQVLNGRFGPYIVFRKENYKLPKGTEATSLTLEDCMKIVSGSTPTNRKKQPAKTAKAASEKKTDTKKTADKKPSAKKTSTGKTTAKKKQ